MDELREPPKDVGPIFESLEQRLLLSTVHVAAMPNTRVIGLSMHDEKAMASLMLKAGASAYLSKDGSSDELLSTVRSVAAGAWRLGPVRPGLARGGPDMPAQRQLCLPGARMARFAGI